MNRGRPKEWPPKCARCGRDGPIPKRNVTPSRTSGARWGFPGRVCNSCVSSLSRNPNAVVLPERQDRYGTMVTREKLAAVILEFRDALAGASVKAQAAALAEMVRLAERV